MAQLVYTALCSLDGYIADKEGNFDWAAPDEEVHAFINDLARGCGTWLLGRRMYDVMVAWETMPTEGEPAPIRDFTEIWHNSDKIVFTRTLAAPSSDRTRIEREFDPEAIRQLKASSAADLSIGGPEIAAYAMQAGLVDAYEIFVAPVSVGGGTRGLPGDVRLDLELIEERRFDSGIVYLRYSNRA